MQHCEGRRGTPRRMAAVLGLLLPDVFPYHSFVSTNRRDKRSPRPEVLAREIALPLAINAGQMDSALAFDIADHLRDRGGIEIIM